MIILLPPSEGKNFGCNVNGGNSLDLQELTRGQALEAPRKLVLDTLIKLGNNQNALKVLGVSEKLASEVQTHQDLRRAPTCPAAQVYTGVLFDAAQLGNWSNQNYLQNTYIASALYGLVRPCDSIRPYRLSINVELPPIGSLKKFWRTQLAQSFQDIGRDQLAIDLRSGSYQALWPPSETNAKKSNTTFVSVRVVQLRDGKEKIISHFAKYWRGVYLKHLEEFGYEIQTPADCLQAALDLTQNQDSEIVSARLEKLSTRVHHLTLVLKA